MSHSNKLISTRRQEIIVKSNNTVKMIEIVQVLNSVGHKLHVIITPPILQRLLLHLNLLHLNLQLRCLQRSQLIGKSFILIGFTVYQISQTSHIKTTVLLGLHRLSHPHLNRK